MKRIIVLLAVFLLIFPVLGSLPTKYSNYEVTVEIQENKLIKENITITFPENVDKFNYYVIHQINNLKIFDDSKEIPCEWRYERAGTLISCKNFDSNKISILFNYYGLITQAQDYNVFSDRYIISTPTDYFNLRVFLPKGYILAEQDKYLTQPAYYPANGVQKTDGRTIYIEWENIPKLGEVYDVSVFYEPALRSDQFVVIILTILIIVAIIAIFIFFKRTPKINGYGLTKDERNFLEVLAKENKISQRKISRKINLSKAQTSRIAKSLEKRGLIKRKRKGRNYEIILK
jgi:uncharacterized membrane protein